MNAEFITHALKGRWNGRAGQALCPAHADTVPSLSIANGINGRVLLHCFAGCNFGQIVKALTSLGLTNNEGGALRPPSPAHYANITLSENRRRSILAQRIWEESQSIHGTSAERYLRRRGITCPLTVNLRHHPSCWHSATRTPHPTMVARIEGHSGFAIHRTYLTKEGSKAALSPSRAMLGPHKGGAVRLRAGQGVLVVAEGIETALSLPSGLLEGSYALWSALSASGLAALSLPPRAQRLVIASDGDETGRKAAAQLAMRASALGWHVETLAAPDGQDWNDVLMKKQGMRYDY